MRLECGRVCFISTISCLLVNGSREVGLRVEPGLLGWLMGGIVRAHDADVLDISGSLLELLLLLLLLLLPGNKMEKAD